jgi:hypothetical protein
LNGERCTRTAAQGARICSYHARIEEVRGYKSRAEEIWLEVQQRMWNGNIPPTLPELVEIILAAHDERQFRDIEADELIERLGDEWAWYVEIRPEPAVEPTTDLQRLALDAQNVHTGAVTRLTSAGLQYLLDVPVPLGQETPEELYDAWDTKNKKERRRVYRDMIQWYDTPTCREKDDHLYHRALDGLWATIKQSPHKEELLGRLWEEASESVEMCCDGHLSRVTNVLVGFHDSVAPPVPVGERLQMAMSAIAERDIPVEHKVGQAWAVFEELKIPMEERRAWIDAF